MKLRLPKWLRGVVEDKGGVEFVDPQDGLESGGPEVPATRAYLRAIRRSQRLKGPGYTRPYRKGRTQRG